MPDSSRPVGNLTDDQIRKRLRVRVQEAAHLLGISPEAVRSRLYRGTLDKETGTDGTVYVRLRADQVRPNDEQTTEQSQPGAEAPLVEELRARVEDLREQLAEEREARRRADTIIAQLARANEEQARTIRELEAPSEARESPESSGPSGGLGEVQVELDTERARREMAGSTLHEGMAEEQRRREKAERERDELRQELHALREPRESSEPGEEQQGRGEEPLSATGGAQEGVQRPWWRRMLGG